MKAKKTKRGQEQEQGQVQPQEPVSLEQLLIKLVQWRPDGDAENLTPALIGPTGSGKTSRVLAIAEALGLPVVRLNLGTMLPEDVLGLPKVGEGVTEWTLPDWGRALIDRPGILFLDELDKARPETYGSVLTLLAERRVRDHRLHSGTLVVAAMQPVQADLWLSEETGRAMTARLVYLPTPYNWAWVGEKFGVDLNGFASPAVELPVSSMPSSRQVSWYIQAHRSGLFTQPELETIGAGLFPVDIYQDLVNRINASTEALKPERIVKRLDNDKSLVESLSIPDLISLAPDIIQHGSPELFECIAFRIWTECTQDERAAFLEAAASVLIERAKAQGGEIEIFGVATEDEVEVMLDRVARRIGEVWQARK